MLTFFLDLSKVCGTRRGPHEYTDAERRRLRRDEGRPDAAAIRAARSSVVAKQGYGASARRTLSRGSCLQRCCMTEASCGPYGAAW